MIVPVFFISELLAPSIFGNENSSSEQLMRSTGFQNPNLRLSCLLSFSLTTTQLWGYVLFLRMICIKHNFGMKKRSTRKTDRSRAGKAPGRPRPLWPRLGLQKLREPLWRIAYLCFIESVLWKGLEKRKKIREKEKKMYEKVQRDITLLFENNILNSNHVQSDNENDALPWSQSFCMPLHMSTILNLLTLELVTLWRNSHDHWLGR